MKKVLISILLIIVLITGTAIIWLATQNSNINISKSVEIKTNPQKAYSIVSNFRTWNEWSPWIALEPTAKTAVIDKNQDSENSLSWTGDLIGSGKITYLSSELNKSIQHRVNFIEPFESEAAIQFKFEPTSDGVIVTWEMKSKMPFLLRFMTSQMQQFIEMDYERGLRMLKDLAETNEVASRVVITGIEPFDGMAYVGKEATCTMDLIGSSMTETMHDVSNWLVASSTFPEEGFSIYHEFGMGTDTCHFTSGYKLLNTHKSFPYAGAIIDSIPRCKILKVKFYGDYKHLGNAWTAGYTYMQHHKIKAEESIPGFEIYLNDPSFFPNPNDWVTEVCIPISQ